MIRIELQAPRLLLDLSREILMKQVGVKEVGRNDGVMIRKYLKSVGLGKGHPYCMAGQYYCFDEAAKELGVKVPIYKSGSTAKVWNEALKIGSLVEYVPQIDDLIFWRKTVTTGHVERIIAILDNNEVETVGFNTGANVRDGEGVYKRIRHTLNPVGKLRIRGLIGWTS